MAIDFSASRMAKFCEFPIRLQQVERAMISTNTETVAGYQITQTKGLVQGNTVRAKHAGRNVAASFKNLVGGEL
jgi:hypothetical protein